MKKPTARASRSTILVFAPAPCGLPTRKEDLADNIPWGPADGGSDWLARFNRDLNAPVSFNGTVRARLTRFPLTDQESVAFTCKTRHLDARYEEEGRSTSAVQTRELSGSMERN